MKFQRRCEYLKMEKISHSFYAGYFAKIRYRWVVQSFILIEKKNFFKIYIGVRNSPFLLNNFWNWLVTGPKFESAYYVSLLLRLTICWYLSYYRNCWCVNPWKVYFVFINILSNRYYIIVLLELFMSLLKTCRGNYMVRLTKAPFFEYGSFKILEHTASLESYRFP